MSDDIQEIPTHFLILENMLQKFHIISDLHKSLRTVLRKQHTGFTVGTGEALETLALVRVNLVSAGSIVLTWSTETVINICKKYYLIMIKFV